MTEKITSSKSMQCVLYQSPLAINHLEVLGVEDDENTLIVELSMISILAPVFDSQNRVRVGLAGLLGDAARIKKIRQHYRRIANPVILASRPPVAVHSTIAALGLLKDLDFDQDHIVVMVHLSEVRRFSYALQFMDSFAFLLDRDDPVPFSLPDAARLLAYMHLLDSDVWKGIFSFKLSSRVETPGKTRMWDDLYTEFGPRFISAF